MTWRILRLWIRGTMLLAITLALPARVVADERIAIDIGTARLKECYPEGLYLYETEGNGSDGCGVRVGPSNRWSETLAATQQVGASRSGAAISGVGSSSDDGQVVITVDHPASGESDTDKRLLIDQVAQLMRVYENGAEMRTLPVSTGMLTSNTFTRAWQGTVGRNMGAVSVDGGMYADQAWYLFPDVFGNILLHSVPYARLGSVRTYDQPEALGVRPSSHGCIRISEEDAAWLREWNPVGVPIEITEPPGPIQRAG